MIFFTSAALYVGASLFFQKKPHYFWKPFVHQSKLMNDALAQRGKKILHISHRGGSFENFENSEKAFHNAVENCKTDVIETDVCLTKDGQVVCFHDTNVKRLCGIDVDLEQLNLSEVKYSKEIDLDFSNKKTFKTQEEDEIKPFLLEDLFKKYPNTHINLELKTKNSQIIVKVDDLIKKYKRENITQWGSFNYAFSKQIQKYNSNQTRFLSSTEFLVYMMSHIFGLLPFLKIEGQIFQIPFYTEEYYQQSLNRSDQSFISRLIIHTQFAILRNTLMFLPSMNEHLNKRGILVFYWVLNTENHFKRCIRSNPNGIITDSPTLLKQYLELSNLNFPHSKSQ